MSDANRMLFLRIALVVFGLTFVFGISLLAVIWPSGWTWGQGESHYLMMIVVVYATLGVSLIMAARDPEAHRSLISFTIWSSAVHGGTMLVQALGDPMEHGHLFGDIPALLLVALVLGALMPKAAFSPQTLHA